MFSPIIIAFLPFCSFFAEETFYWESFVAHLTEFIGMFFGLILGIELLNGFIVH